MAERVERFTPIVESTARGTKEARVLRTSDGGYVRYSDYEKLEAQRDKRGHELTMLDYERAKEMDRAEKAEAQRDQARQEVLEEVAAEFDREAEKYARKRAECKAAEKRDQASGKLPDGHTYEATWNYYEGLSRANEWAASHCRSLATLDPSGEEERGDCEECNGHGYLRTDQPGLEDCGVEPESEPCEACGGTGKKSVTHPSGEAENG
jgi:hypothetical protein